VACGKVLTRMRRNCVNSLLYFSSYKLGGGAKLEVEFSAAFFVLGICKNGPNTLKKLVFTLLVLRTSPHRTTHLKENIYNKFLLSTRSYTSSKNEKWKQWKTNC
jgi:hypothetical protein